MSLGQISGFIQSKTASDPEMQAWLDSNGVGDNGTFIFDLGQDPVSPKELWSNFSQFASRVSGGQHHRVTAEFVYQLRTWISSIDLDTATTINEEVLPLKTEFESLKLAVASKDPEAVASTFSSPEDKKVILGLLVIISHQLTQNPDSDTANQLEDTAASLIKIFNGEKLSKEELIKLEPQLESLGIKMFSAEYSPDFVTDMIKRAYETSQEARNLLDQQLGQ